MHEMFPGRRFEEVLDFSMSAFGALNRSRGRWEDAPDGQRWDALASGEVRVLDGVPDSASYPLCDLVTSPSLN